LDGSFDIEFGLTKSPIARFDMETRQSELFKTLKLRSKLIYGKANLRSYGDEDVSLLLPDLMLNLKTGPSWLTFLKPILEKWRLRQQFPVMRRF
jgi:hypothetical protein